MEIYLNTDNIINDIGGKYLQESLTADPIPAKGMLVQSINECNAKLFAVLGKFLNYDLKPFAEDSLSSASLMVYDLVLSPRKMSGKAQALADTMHSFLVNAVLSKVFATRKQADLATMHENMALADAQQINIMLHTKSAPRE